MNPTNRSRFVYVTYIRTTPAQLWKALTDPQIIRQYRFGTAVECDWKKGSSWKMTHPDRGLLDTGEILEIDPPRRMVIRWQNEWDLEFKTEGPSRCTIELESEDHSVKLTVTHEIDRPDSPFITAVSDGWPRILSNLKSLLETGEIVL
jgi:uncharacterized protein YndB with AHSA1/START domain